MAYRNRREPNLYPADARWILPGYLVPIVGIASEPEVHLDRFAWPHEDEHIEARHRRANSIVINLLRPISKFLH